jgi:hypothetical protein
MNDLSVIDIAFLQASAPLRIGSSSTFYLAGRQLKFNF